MSVPDIPDVDWGHVEDCWRGLGELLEPPIREIVRPFPPADIDNLFIRWCPSKNIQDLVGRDDLAMFWSALWGTKPSMGSLHTAEMLFDRKTDPSLTQAILIAAAIKDMLDGLPDHWRGGPCRLLFGMMIAARNRLEQGGLYWWHHASRNALPEPLPIDLMEAPSGVYGVLRVARTGIMGTMALWTILVVSRSQGGSRLSVVR